MQEEIHDPDTGEILQSVQVRDEMAIPVVAFTGGDIINQLEDGQFSQDLHNAARDLVLYLEEVAHQTGGKAKGTINLKLVFSKEDNALRIASDLDVKKPKMPRVKSIAWTDQNGNLSRFPPQQLQMLNIKSVGGSGGLRRV